MFSKAHLFLPMLCLLAACGFTPIYGSHTSSDTTVAADMNNVAIANIPDRVGQELRNHLIDRMYFKGRPSEPQYRLEVTLKSSEADLGIQKDATASRSQLDMNATYVLRKQDGTQLITGNAHCIVSYSKLDAQYGTLASQQNAYDRAVNEVGEEIVNRLSLYFAERTDAGQANRKPPASP